MDEYSLKAYAKINLGLDVIGRLPNGYHQVKMIMSSIGLCDVLTLEKAGEGIAVTTDSALLPTDESNLVYQAAKLMMNEYGIRSGIRIHIEKKIPMAAGLAGGSTDAAAAMKGISHLYGLNVPLPRLMELGVSIGADVPYCIMGGTALAEGIGEKLTALPPAPPCHILIAKPPVSVSTKYVYEHLDAVKDIRHPDIDGMTAAIMAHDLDGILERMGNVLERVTVPAYPVIESVKSQMRVLGADNCLMSGSGPTVFGIFRDRQKAEAAYGIMKETPGNQVFLTAAV